MIRSRLYVMVGTLALVVGGAAAVLSRVLLGTSVDSCVGAPAGTANLAVQVRLLVPNPLCPQGLFSPGPTAVSTLRLTVVLALSVVVAVLLLLLSALGAGFTARRVLRAVRDWVLVRLLPVPAPAAVAVENRRPMVIPVRPPIVQETAGRPDRRGPPASCSA